jgi:transposase
VDFGFAYVDVAGERQQVALFVMSLPYSDALYIQAFPRECTEAFLEGHNRAFRFIGGVPRKIRYDNSKIAVAKITGSRERQVTKEFQRLQSHYLFETQFCLVRRANEKGHVECLVDFCRANFLVPVPKWRHSLSSTRRSRSGAEPTWSGNSGARRPRRPCSWGMSVRPSCRSRHRSARPGE